LVGELDVGTPVCSCLRALAFFAACPFWMGRGFFIFGWRFFAGDSLCLLCERSSLLLLLGFFCYDAEKNTMNHISTLFPTLYFVIAPMVSRGCWDAAMMFKHHKGPGYNHFTRWMYIVISIFDVGGDTTLSA
jgi:hypothetical protein